MQVKNNRGILIVSIICSVVLLGVLSSYAYFINDILGQEQEVTLNTGSLELVFEDGNDGINASLNFGESIEKYFTIENTGTLDAVTKINWLNLVNTYLEGSLTYNFYFKEEENFEYSEILLDELVPSSDVAITENLVGELEVPAGKKYYYKLVIKLNDLKGVDQTADLNAFFNSNFILEECGLPHKLTFNYNEGTTGILEKTVYEGSKYGNLPIPEREGYFFAGWFTSETGGEEITKDSLVEIKADQPLYARWETENERKVNKVLAKLGITPKTGKPDLGKIATTDEGVYGLEDNYGTSYYYRGAVTNNYVKFGNYYWRIIRINGDGSLRMIYDGTSAHSNGTSSSNRVAITGVLFNDTYHEDVKYVGYMFGGSIDVASTSKSQAQSNGTSSNIKNVLETWFRNNIKNKNLDEFVADNIFCNDRSTKGNNNSTTYPSDTGRGYGINSTEYGPATRLMYWESWTTPIARDEPMTTFKCVQKNDAFTKDDTVMGNGALSEKIGLITADEINAAGGLWIKANKYFYLYKGVDYWTMSPGFAWLDRVGFRPDLLYYDANAGLNNRTFPEPANVAPVINLTYDYVMQMIGDGTSSNVFRVE